MNERLYVKPLKKNLRERIAARRTAGERGFTLLEMLVVLVIVGLLVSAAGTGTLGWAHTIVPF